MAFVDAGEEFGIEDEAEQLQGGVGERQSAANFEVEYGGHGESFLQEYQRQMQEDYASQRVAQGEDV